MSHLSPVPPADDSALWQSTAGSDLAHELPEDLRPRDDADEHSDEIDAGYRADSADDGADDGFDSFRDASLVAALQPAPRRPRTAAAADEARKNRWRGAEEFTPAADTPSPLRETAGFVVPIWIWPLAAIAVAAGGIAIYVGIVRQYTVLPVARPFVAEQPPPAEPPGELPRPALPPSVPSPMPGETDPPPPVASPIVTPADPMPAPMLPEPALPVESLPQPVAPLPMPMAAPPPMPAPPAPMPQPLPPELKPLSSPRAETLLSMARQLEASGRIEAAIRRYESLVDKFRGTAVAEEAQARLAALRAKPPGP